MVRWSYVVVFHAVDQEQVVGTGIAVHRKSAPPCNPLSFVLNPLLRRRPVAAGQRHKITPVQRKLANLSTLDHRADISSGVCT